VPRWTDLPDKYILFVGNRGQYKDAEVLLRAFAHFRLQYPDVTLLFVGGGLFTSKENRLIASLGISGHTVQRSLPDQEMSSAYGNAFFTVFPSRFEGFGLPALESMACGAATLLADATSLPEVGGDAALYFSSGDAPELAERMLELAGNTPLREEKGRAGILQASKFSWERCAQETANVYAATLSQ
jgi:glycosyltransferase involved in cell wall biosynthesis